MNKTDNIVRGIATSLLLSFLAFGALKAQQLELLWSTSYFAGVNDIVNGIIQSSTGELFAFGTTAANPRARMEGLVLVVDPETGAQKSRIQLDDEGLLSQEIHSMFEKKDGTLVLLCSVWEDKTKYSRRQRSDLAEFHLLHIDRSGKILEKIIIEKQKGVTWSKVFSDKFGDVLVIGHKLRSRPWMLPIPVIKKFSPLFQPLKYTEIPIVPMWQLVHVYESDNDGNLVLGNATDRSSISIALDRDLAVRSVQNYSDSIYRAISFSSLTPNGKILLVGQQGKKVKHRELWIAEIDLSGKNLVERSFFGGAAEINPVAGAKTIDGERYFILSHDRAFLLSQSIKQSLTLPESYGPHSQQFSSLCSTNNGVFFIANNKEDRRERSFINIFAIGYNTPNNKEDSIKLVLESRPLLIDEDTTGTLTAGERGYISISIRNVGNEPFYGGKIEVQNSVIDQGLNVPRNIPLGYIGVNQVKDVSIPVIRNEQARPAISEFRIQVKGKDETILLTTGISIRLFNKPVQAYLDREFYLYFDKTETDTLRTSSNKTDVGVKILTTELLEKENITVYVNSEPLLLVQKHISLDKVNDGIYLKEYSLIIPIQLTQPGINSIDIVLHTDYRRFHSKPLLIDYEMIPCKASFPWPPPKPSATHVLDSAVLTNANSLGDVEAVLRKALDDCGYLEKSYYQVCQEGAPRGFALVARMEQTDNKAYSLPLPERWEVDIGSKERFSLGTILRVLFAKNPGYFRIIVFLVTDLPFQTSGKEISRREGMSLLQSGMNVLPSNVKSAKLNLDYNCTALIYEFEVPESGQEPKFLDPSRFLGKIHLERSQLLKALLE